MSKAKIDRRNFLQKATMVLGAAGVSPFIKQELVHDAVKLVMPEAHASGRPQVRRMIELCFRQGVPFINIGTGREIASLSKPKYVTNPYKSEDYIQKGSLYISPSAAPLAEHADHIAISQSFKADGIPHTPMFPIREGGKGAGKTTPIISLAAKADGYSIVPGVNWYLKTINGCCGPMKTIENKLNGKEDLVAITSNDAFSNLFVAPELRVSEAERDAILEVSQKLSNIQVERMVAMANSQAILKSHEAGVAFLKEPIADVLETTTMDSGFNFGKDTLFGKKWHDTGHALAKTLKAFANNLMATATISVTTTDAWHGYNKTLDPKYNQSAGMAEHIGSVLAAAITYMKNTPDPASPGHTLFDTTIIFCSSEFTRGISGVGMNLRDQSTNGFILIGKDVKGGYYGTFNTSGSTAKTYGFDPLDGSPLSEQNSLDQVHNTICHLLGLHSEMIPGVPKLDVMLRNA